MSNYPSEILPRLKAFACDPARKGLRVALVEAPPVGKTRQLVPDLWRHVKSQQPQRRGIYVVKLTIEAAMLAGTYPNEKKIEEVRMVDKTWSVGAPSALGLVSYPGLLSLLDPEEESPPVLGPGAMLFLDLEDQPSFEGERMLALVFSWTDRLKDSHDVTMVLLGSHVRDAVRRVVQDLLRAEVLMLRWTDESWSEPSFRHVESPSEAQKLVRDALLKDRPDSVPEDGEIVEPGRPPGPCVLLFMSLYEAKTYIIEPMMDELKGDQQIHLLSRASTIKGAKDAWTNPRARFICVDRSFSCSFALPDMRLAICIGESNMRSFQKDSSQFPVAPVPLTRCERDRHWAWVQKSAEGATSRQVLHTFWPPENYHASPTTSLAAVEGELMRLCLWARFMYRSISPLRVPIPSLGEIDPLMLKESTRRLEVMRCVKSTDGAAGSRWLVTALGEATLFYTEGSSHQHAKDIHLGNLTAQISEGQTLTRKAKGVLCRLAAIIRSGGILGFSEQGERLLVEEDDGFLEALKAECVGLGQEQAANGSLWLALGVLSKLRDEGVLHAKNTQEKAFRVGRNLIVDMRQCIRTWKYVEELEEMLELTPLESEDRATQLTYDELCQVNDALMWAYLDQMVFVPFTPRGEGLVDLLSLRPVDMCCIPVRLGWLLREFAHDEPGGFLGVYQTSVQTAETGQRLQIRDFTLIPNHRLQQVVDYFDGRELSLITSTVYPVPTGKRLEQVGE
ncbi:hypothetical protein DL770_010576 [Monosporascus sp. CRB-9-2]|nr:hypothetical protein DL770_010576 [Monosporascus sp. CRB-9-2]